MQLTQFKYLKIDWARHTSKNQKENDRYRGNHPGPY